MSLYEPPFLIPSEAQVRPAGLHIGRFYGQAKTSENAPNLDATLEQIEQYAPTVAKLIAGLSPEESAAVLKVRIETLGQYKNIPLIGVYAKNKIREYKAQLTELEAQADQARFQRLITTAGYVVALMAVGGVAFYYFSAGYRQIKEAQ